MHQYRYRSSFWRKWGVIVTLSSLFFFLSPPQALGVSHLRITRAVSQEPQYRGKGGGNNGNALSFSSRGIQFQPKQQRQRLVVPPFHSSGQAGADEYTHHRQGKLYLAPNKFGKIGSIFVEDFADNQNKEEEINLRKIKSLFSVPNKEGEWKPRLFPVKGGPSSFTPYLGARALPNLQKFFEHIQENLEALMEESGAGITE